MSDVPWTRPRRYAAYWIAWTVFGLFFFTQDVSRQLLWNSPIPWWSYLLTWMFSVWLYAAVTPAMLWMGRRFPMDRARWWRSAPVHVLASVAIAVAHVSITSLAAPYLGVLGPVAPPRYRDVFTAMLVIAVHGNVLSYWLVLGLQHGVQIYRRYQDREQAALRLEAQAAAMQAQLSLAQLSALKAQLQPHFLFNTLNAIMVLVRQRQVHLAEETLARFSDLLRFVLDDAFAQEVSLRRELDHLELYLAIEQLRFADRMRVELEADPAALGGALPHMSLQPLVENAVRHGISARAGAGLVRVRARRRDDELVVEIEDDGPGHGPATGQRGPAEGAERGGIGLANTRARLQQLYGDRASLSLRARPEGGAISTLVVPFHLASELPS
jgi:two-component system LytT family sensor kinase